MRLLAYTSPARGHLYPIVPVLCELRRRGHGVAVCALAGELDALRALGIAADPIDDAVGAVELDDYRARTQPGRARRALATFAERARHELADVRAAIERHRPDALLIDVNCWGAGVVAERSGLPWAIYSPYLLPLSSSEAPPPGLGMAPLRGPLGRMRNVLLGRASAATLNRTAMPTVDGLRECEGLTPLSSYRRLLGRPDLLLALTAEGFELPRREWPANVRFVGPIDWSPPAPAPEWIGQLGDPLVLVTCSTERQSDARLLRAALSGLPPRGLHVLGTSAAHDPAAFPAPAGSRVVRFLSHDAVLRRLACVVCHGGMGITQKALAAGVPVVVVPFGRDQLDVARRVEHAGAGLFLRPRGLTAARLARAARQAIALRAGAERMARLFAAAGGPTAAAEHLEALVSARSRAHV